MKTNLSLKTTSLAIIGAAALLLAIMFSLPSLTHADTLYRQLDIGATGTDVSALQTYLAQDSSIYPEGLVTGYFGSLTSAAVSRFQTRNGIEAVGRVGPKTLAALNAKMSGGVTVTTGDVNAPIIFGVNVAQATSSAVVTWNTSEPASGLVYYSPSPLLMSEAGNGVSVSGTIALTDSNYRTAHSVSISGLLPNTTYYYSVRGTDQSGNVNVTWPTTLRTNQ